MYPIPMSCGWRGPSLPAYLIALIAALLLSAGHAAAQSRDRPVPLHSWYGDYRNSNTVIVFVHGIFGDNNTFLHRGEGGPQGDVFWPDLLSGDAALGKASIFMGGFYTSPTSRDYATDFAARDLFAALKRPHEQTRRAVLDHKNIVFVGHSTGGIVVRHLLMQQRDHLKDKNIGLVLIASPSLGSRWADRLSPIAALAGNQLAEELEDESPFLMQLDASFKDLLASRALNIDGIEAAENHFVVNCFFCLSKVVEVSSAARYFPAARMLPNTDHFSSVKPDSREHPAHRLLADFYREHFLPRTAQYAVAPPTSAVVKVRTEAPVWSRVPADAAPVVTRVMTAVDGVLCAAASDDAPVNPDCTLTLRAPAHNPFQLGDYRLDNVRLKCRSANNACAQYTRSRADSVVDGAITRSEVTLRFAGVAPAAAADAVPVIWELSADLLQMQLDAEHAQVVERQLAYGEVIDVPASRPGEVVSLEARLLDSTARIQVGEDAAEQGLALVESAGGGEAAVFRYQVGRP